MTNEFGYFVHASSFVDEGASIGRGTKVWHFCHVMRGAKVGEDCSFGQNVMIGGEVRVGRNVKIQNNVSVYTGTTIEDDVFLGPSCVLTNVSNPRSQVVRRDVYEQTLIRRGATIGANATIVCGVTLGRYAFVAAGAVVTKSFPDYAMIVGVPGIQVGWMSRHGHRLEFDSSDLASCAETGLRYERASGVVRCLDYDEDTDLPSDLCVGKKSYRDF